MNSGETPTQQDARGAAKAAPPLSCVMCWSGGKDSSMALERLMRDPGFQVDALVTTVTSGYDRISMHGVRRSLLKKQAAAIGLPLREVSIPMDADNDIYERSMGREWEGASKAGINHVGFGDIFLEDLREYREKQIAKYSLKGIFPLWKLDTGGLACDFIDRGYRAVLVCVDTQAIDASFAGREFDDSLLKDLPASADPCGENGEFHTFVYDGPIFSKPIAVRRGRRVLRKERFQYCDLLAG